MWYVLFIYRDSQKNLLALLSVRSPYLSVIIVDYSGLILSMACYIVINNISGIENKACKS